MEPKAGCTEVLAECRWGGGKSGDDGEGELPEEMGEWGETCGPGLGSRNPLETSIEVMAVSASASVKRNCTVAVGGRGTRNAPGSKLETKWVLGSVGGMGSENAPGSKRESGCIVMVVITEWGGELGVATGGTGTENAPRSNEW